MDGCIPAGRCDEGCLGQRRDEAAAAVEHERRMWAWVCGGEGAGSGDPHDLNADQPQPQRPLAEPAAPRSSKWAPSFPSDATRDARHSPLLPTLVESGPVAAASATVSLKAENGGAAAEPPATGEAAHALFPGVAAAGPVAGRSESGGWGSATTASAGSVLGGRAGGGGGGGRSSGEAWTAASVVAQGVPASDAAGVAALAARIGAKVGMVEPFCDPLTLLRFYNSREKVYCGTFWRES